MKKKVKKEVAVEITMCNICEKEIRGTAFRVDRINMVRGLGKTKDFDAHESCINKVMRNAFKKYFEPTH